MRRSQAVLLVAGLAAALFAQAVPLEERLALCAGCHGTTGISQLPETPHLAGLQPRYFIQQMKDFKSGKRASALMSPILAAIDDSEFEALAAYFREQKPPAPGKGNPAMLAKGKDIYFEGIVASAVPACSGCHNEDGTGTNRYPRVAGQQVAYLIQQMLGYKTGSRDNDDRGVMRTVAQRMTETEIRAVAEYIVTMKGDAE
jgi:cytochrome c553